MDWHWQLDWHCLHQQREVLCPHQQRDCQQSELWTEGLASAEGLALSAFAEGTSVSTLAKGLLTEDIVNRGIGTGRGTGIGRGIGTVCIGRGNFCERDHYHLHWQRDLLATALASASSLVPSAEAEGLALSSLEDFGIGISIGISRRICWQLHWHQHWQRDLLAMAFIGNCIGRCWHCQQRQRDTASASILSLALSLAST